MDVRKRAERLADDNGLCLDNNDDLMKAMLTLAREVKEAAIAACHAEQKRKYEEVGNCATGPDCADAIEAEIKVN